MQIKNSSYLPVETCATEEATRSDSNDDDAPAKSCFLSPLLATVAWVSCDHSPHRRVYPIYFESRCLMSLMVSGFLRVSLSFTAGPAWL